MSRGPIPDKPPYPRPPLWDPDTGFRSGQRRSEVWCEECGAFFHFSNAHPHPKGSTGRRVDWPPQQSG